jgi:transporter family protein
MATDHMHPLWLQAINSAIGLMCIPFFFAILKRNNAVSSIDSTGLLWAVITSITGLIAYAAFTFALRSGNVGTTTILCSTYPILTLVLSALFLGEAITLPKLAGMFMVLGGMVLVAR